MQKLRPNLQIIEGEYTLSLINILQFVYIVQWWIINSIHVLHLFKLILLQWHNIRENGYEVDNAAWS